MLTGYLWFGDEKVEIWYVAGERGFAKQAFDALGKALPALTAYFNLAEPLPKVRVVLTPDREEFDRLVRDLLRVEIEVPSHPARIAQPQRTDMVLLSPSAYESDSIFTYLPEHFKRLLAHELVHMVEERLSPNIEAIPRWWSEGLAVYLSEQWRYEDEFRKPALEGIAQHEIPSLRQVEAERKLAYDWGWAIVRFIESAYGRERIVRAVQECSDGDVFSVIGVEAHRLEIRWRQWLIGNKRLV